MEVKGWKAALDDPDWFIIAINEGVADDGDEEGR